MRRRLTVWVVLGLVLVLAVAIAIAAMQGSGRWPARVPQAATPTVNPAATPALTAPPGTPGEVAPQGATPFPEQTASPPASSALPCPCEEIVILNPSRGVTITDPVTVSGVASSPFEQTVVVAVLDGSGAQIGIAPGIVVGEMGERGLFTVTVPFAAPVNSQPGRIQVFTESPRDGAMEHLSSVTVSIQGLDLDALLERLETALDGRDYAALQSLMGSPFLFGLYPSEWSEMPAADALEMLRRDYLTRGAPWLDFSVDALRLLGDRISLPPEVVHVVFSPGWGANGDDDAFLLIAAVEGLARWTGLLYVPQDQIEYR